MNRAEWAGNSVPVLLSTYAKCIVGSEQAALKHLGWLNDTDDPARTPSTESAGKAVAHGHPPGKTTTAAARPRRQHDPNWYEFACTYAESKHDALAPASRRAIADALAIATEALLEPGRPGAWQPAHAELRQALAGWAFNRSRRSADAVDDVATILDWVRQNTPNLSALQDADVLSRIQRRFARRADGSAAAASVAARRRSILFGALRYAADGGLLRANPLLFVARRPQGVTHITRPRSD